MAYTIVNPGAGNVYYDTAGSAISAQPTINTGRSKNLGRNQTLLSNSAHGIRDDTKYGSVVITGQFFGTEAAVTAGADFAKMTAGRYIMMRGGANTEFVHGDAYNSLRAGASEKNYRRSIKYGYSLPANPLTATALRNNQWNQVSGFWTTAPTASTDGYGDVAGNAATGLDHAIVPSSVVPGELTYQFGSNVANNDNYAERFLW